MQTFLNLIKVLSTFFNKKNAPENVHKSTGLLWQSKFVANRKIEVMLIKYASFSKEKNF